MVVHRVLDERFGVVRRWVERTLSCRNTPEASPYSWLLIEDQLGLEVVAAGGIIEPSALRAHVVGGAVEWGAWINYRREGPHPSEPHEPSRPSAETITAYVQQNEPADSDVRRARGERCAEGLLRLASWEPTV